MMDQTAPGRRRLGLTWRAPDAAAAARRLSSALGRSIDTGVPITIGRLVVRVDTSPGFDRFEVLDLTTDERSEVDDRNEPSDPIAVGWATVELDRAERDLRDAGLIEGSTIDDGLLDALGGRARRAPVSAFGVPVVLLEPVTEGRLAAGLARHGEGPCALLIGSADAGSPSLRPGGTPAGPHLLVHDGGYHPAR
jgi:hypothetical protein